MQAAMISIRNLLHFRLEANTTLRVGNLPSHGDDENFLPSYTTDKALQCPHRARLSPRQQEQSVLLVGN